MKLEFKHLVEAVVSQQPELVFGGIQKQNNQLNVGDSAASKPMASAPAPESSSVPPPVRSSAPSQVNPNKPFPLPWEPGGSADSADGEYVPTPGSKKPEDTTPVTPPTKPQPKPQAQPQSQPQAQPQPQPQPQPQAQPQSPSERYRQSQERYEASRRAHGEFVNKTNKGAWTIGESVINMQFKRGHLSKDRRAHV